MLVYEQISQTHIFLSVSKVSLLVVDLGFKGDLILLFKKTYLGQGLETGTIG